MSKRKLHGAVRGAGRTLLLIGLLLIAPQRAAAQDARVVTFEEAVQIALRQNIELKQAVNASELDAINVNRRRMNFYPDLSFGTSGRQSYGRTFSQEDLNFVNETTESFSADVSTNINVFNGYSDVANLKQARLTAEAGEFELERAEQTVVFNVMDAYIELIERRQQVTVQEENLEAVRQQLDQIREFARVGRRPISDVYQQEAIAANAELNLISAQRAYQLSEGRLIQILQLDPFDPYEFVAPDIDELELAVRDYQLDSLLRNAFTRRSDLRAAETSIRAADQGIRVAKSSYWPSIGLGFGYGTGWNSRFRDFRTGETLTFFDQLNQQRGGAVSLRLTLPIFDRFTTRNNTQAAQVQRENAALELDGLQQRVAVQVRQAYLDYATAQKSIEVAQAQLRAAELALEAAQERYNVGSATLVEVSEARSSYVEAQTALLSARYDLIFRDKLIEYYTGVLDPDQGLLD